MMNKLSILLLSVLGVFALASCDEGDVGPVANTNNPGAPSITSPESGQSYTLSRDQAEDTLMTIEWSEPDFGFPSAPTYDVELGVAGNNFADAMQIASVQEKTIGITVNDLNSMLLTAGLQGGQSHSIELRVVASISDSVSEAVSEPVSITVTPFQTDFPPIYMIGPAVSDWALDQAVIVPSSQPNEYTTLAEFTNGGAFRFFDEPDWGAESYNYPHFDDNGGTIDALLVNAQDGDSNFEFTGQTGWYRITVNLETLTVEMEEAEEPVMYMTGEGVGGWDTPGSGESVKMTFIQEGVYEATTEFINAGAFRFFGQADWSPVSYNYPYFTGGTIDELLINAEDGDSNFEFTGETGTYYIKVDINELAVEMEAN